MEIDVREIKGNSEIQTSASLHWDRAGAKLARCVVNVSQSTEYYPPTELLQERRQDVFWKQIIQLLKCHTKCLNKSFWLSALLTFLTLDLFVFFVCKRRKKNIKVYESILTAETCQKNLLIIVVCVDMFTNLLQTDLMWMFFWDESFEFLIVLRCDVCPFQT